MDLKFRLRRAFDAVALVPHTETNGISDPSMIH